MKAQITSWVLALAKRLGLFVYKFAKADTTATVVVFFDSGRTVLIIRRAKEPFTGKMAFPSAFLSIGEENLRSCGQRGVLADTQVLIDEDDLIPIDERSEPNRDPRGHVVDHGFVVIAGDELKRQALSKMRTTKDSKEVRLTSVATLLSMDMAFDHRELLLAALQAAGFPAN